MSETSARASRFAFWFGSFARNGLIGFRSAGAGVVGVTTGIAGDVTAIDATDGGVGGGRSPGGMTDGAAAPALVPMAGAPAAAPAGGARGRIGGMGGRVDAGAGA